MMCGNEMSEQDREHLEKRVRELVEQSGPAPYEYWLDKGTKSGEPNYDGMAPSEAAEKILGADKPLTPPLEMLREAARSASPTRRLMGDLAGINRVADYEETFERFFGRDEGHTPAREPLVPPTHGRFGCDGKYRMPPE